MANFQLGGDANARAAALIQFIQQQIEQYEFKVFTRQSWQTMLDMWKVESPRMRTTPHSEPVSGGRIRVTAAVLQSTISDLPGDYELALEPALWIILDGDRYAGVVDLLSSDAPVLKMEAANV